jgi:hypothetical protein
MLNATCYSFSLFLSFSFFQGKEQREREGRIGRKKFIAV